MDLNGKKILLGVTGGISAYKSVTLLRLLQKQGAEIRVVMTDASTEFVGPLTFASLTRFPVYTSKELAESSPFRHIDYPRWADLFLIVPCSANTLAKLVHGLADDPVSLCFMAATCPKWVAPAMNSAMYASVAVQNNLRMLKNFENVQVLEASAGFLACGEEGPGRLIESEEILNRLLVFAENVNPVFKGKKVLISAGRTREAIDTVRYISNSSSGKTAVALASVFLESGFSVTVVKGQMEAEFPPGVQIVSVESALDMHSQIMALASDFDVIVHAAAVADFRPKMVSDKKIKGSSSLLQIELEPNPNILRETVKQKKNGQVIVGFALETDDFEANAIEKLEKSGADLLVLNTPVAKNSGFGFDQVSYALLFDAKRIPPLKMNSKKQLAKEVLDFIKQAWTSSDDFTELHNA